VRQSLLKSFSACPRQYYYSSVLDLGPEKVGSLTIFGTIIHFVFDVYEQYGFDVDLAHRTLDTYWDQPSLIIDPNNGRPLHIDYWHYRTNQESLRKRGHKMIDSYHELTPWRIGRLLGTEIPFEVPLGDHVLTGSIDKLWALRGQHTLEVVDFKTAAAVPKKLKYNVQFTAYCYATTRPEFWAQFDAGEELYGVYKSFTRKGLWYHARTGKVYNAGARTEDDYRRLLLQADEMERAINTGVFPLDYSGENCGWCPFADEICGSEVQLVETAQGVDMVRRPDDMPQAQGALAVDLSGAALEIVDAT
jgi:hypothetical protein